MHISVIDLARELISVPGYTELKEKEANVAIKLHDILKGYNIKSTLIDIGNRYNVLAEYNSGKAGPTVVLCTHLDTVPPYDMPNPFEGLVKDGRLFGRGAVDVRGILAAMTLSMKKLYDDKPDICGKICMLAVADEESGSAGMRHFIHSGARPDLVIVGEPTSLRLGTAHKGVCWIKVSFFGKSAHGSVPEEGHNAIYDASRFIELINTKLIPALENKTHRMLGHPTINVGQIKGGTRPTIVPEKCEVYIDRRLVPGETCDSALNEIIELLENERLTNPSMSYSADIILGSAEAPFPPLDSGRYTDILSLLDKSVKKNVVRKDCDMNSPCGLSFWTDAALPGYFLDTPSFVIGPGNIAQAHSNDEWVEIEQLKSAVNLYYDMVVSACSPENKGLWK